MGWFSEKIPPTLPEVRIVWSQKSVNWADPLEQPIGTLSGLPGISAVHQDGRIRPGDLALLPSLAGTAWVGWRKTGVNSEGAFCRIIGLRWCMNHQWEGDFHAQKCFGVLKNWSSMEGVEKKRKKVGTKIFTAQKKDVEWKEPLQGGPRHQS